jgi:hypothetical protein
MSRTLTAARTLVGGLGAWFARTLAWLTITAALTLGGASLLMLFKDWTLQSLFTSMMVWPMLAIGALLAMPVALFPVGRPFVYSAAGWALVYNLILLFA